MKLFKSSKASNKELTYQLIEMCRAYAQYSLFGLNKLINTLLKSIDSIDETVEDQIKDILKNHNFSIHISDMTNLCLQIKAKTNMLLVHLALAQAILIDTINDIIKQENISAEHLYQQVQAILFNLHCYQQYFDFIEARKDGSYGSGPVLTTEITVNLINYIQQRLEIELPNPSLTQEQNDYINSIEASIENQKSCFPCCS